MLLGRNVNSPGTLACQFGLEQSGICGPYLSTHEIGNLGLLRKECVLACCKLGRREVEPRDLVRTGGNIGTRHGPLIDVAEDPAAAGFVYKTNEQFLVEYAADEWGYNETQREGDA